MHALPDPKPGRLWLLLFPGLGFERLWDLVARMAVSLPLRVLDAGNCFDAYAVAGRLRRLTTQLEPALERISVARSFTCYQAAALLENAPAGATPTLVLELLSTFYDENVPAEERRLLLSGCAAQLRRLAVEAPVVVGLRRLPEMGAGPGFSSARAGRQGELPEAAPAQELSLLEILEEAADQVWRFEWQAPAPPPRLF